MQPSPVPEGVPQAMRPTPQLMMPLRRVNWIVIDGGVLILIGSILVGIAVFSFAETLVTSSSADTIRLLYELIGTGTILSGVGILMALVGLAMPQRA